MTTACGREGSNRDDEPGDLPMTIRCRIVRRKRPGRVLTQTRTRTESDCENPREVLGNCWAFATGRLACRCAGSNDHVRVRLRCIVVGGNGAGHRTRAVSGGAKTAAYRLDYTASVSIQYHYRPADVQYATGFQKLRPRSARYGCVSGYVGQSYGGALEWYQHQPAEPWANRLLDRPCGGIR